MLENEPTTAQLAALAASRALELYAASPALRAIVVALPFVSALDALAGTAGSNLALDRLQLLLAELGQRQLLLEERFRDQQVTWEDLVDAAIRGVRGALETGDRAKVRMLASVLVGATSTERPPGLDAESVVDSLAGLTPADLAYARRLADAQRDNRFAFIDYSAAPLPDPDTTYRLMRLQGAGLLEAESAAPSWEAGSALNYRLTPTFWRILDFLRAGGEVIADPPG